MNFCNTTKAGIAMLAAQTVCNGLNKNIVVTETTAPRPGPRQVLLEAHASSVNPLNYMVHRGIKHVPFLNIIPGHDVAGVITAVGSKVTDLQVGDAVFGCRPGLFGGAYSQQVVMPASAVARKPDCLSMQQAAALPMVALTALQALRNAGLKAGDAILIMGASGGVGTVAVQIAKALGASVTGVCSGANVELVRGLGADAVVDYSQQSILDLPTTFDVVFDIIGQYSLGRCRKLLTPQGCYVTTQYKASVMANWLLTGSGNATQRQRARLVSMRPRQQDLQQIAAWCEAGQLTPVIDREYTMTQIPEAFEYSASGRVRGKLVIALR